MSSSGINFSGLGSGIDTEGIIKQLMTLGQRPVQLLQQRQQQIQQQQTAISQVAATISGLQAAASALDDPNAFSIVQASSVDSTIATATASAGAQVGSHSLQVTQLAQSQRVASIDFLNQTNALSVAGQIVINGKAINVAATDSLQAIAANINNAQVGVNATIISPTTGTYKLILSSINTGTSNALSLSDAGSGTILGTTLGLIGAGTSVRNSITNGAASNLFTDSSTSIGTLLGLSSPQVGTVQINGTGVAIDFGVDSLTAIANKINTAGIAGVAASVIATTDPNTGASRQQLQITGASTPAFIDSNNILSNLGVLQNTPTSELQAAKDAKFKLDNIDITRSSNSVSDVISGVTLALLKDTGSPSTQINVTTDTASIKKNIQTFVSQFNQLNKTVTNLSQFDPETLVAGPLFGDVNTQNVLNSLTDIFTNSVGGLAGSKVTLAQLGIKLDTSGQLNITDADLDSALANDLSQVAKIFKSVGTTTDSSISYISSSEKTKAAASSGYAINVTQIATQASITAGTAHTADDNASTEVLTFNGGQFGASGKTLLVNPNSTLNGLISQINGDAILGAAVTASNVGGRLQITAKQYGSSYAFTVSSSQAAAGNNSGIGDTPLSGTGLDVAGSINGESATGKGQFLTGTAGNATTDGLQLRVTSTTAGAKGILNFTQGIAAQARYFAISSTDFISGTLSQYTHSLDTQVSDIGDQIKDLQDGLKAQETLLRSQFAAMEDAVTKIKAAGAGLAALANISK